MKKANELSSNDARQIKHFKIFLTLRGKFGFEFLAKRRFWRRYLNLDGKDGKR